VIRTFQRIIDTGGAFTITPYRTGGEWRYSGITATAGFQWDPVGAVRLAGAAHWSQDLEAEAVSAADETTARFKLPTEYRLGASGVLTPRLTLSAGLSYADWQPSEDLLEQEDIVGTVWSYGAGLEWAGLDWGLRNFPIRIGYRRSDLPFTFQGTDPAETLFSGGIGMNLLPMESGFIAVADLGIERGTRDSGSLSESFWRMSLTLRVGSF
jgi:hypothetical protein